MSEAELHVVKARLRGGILNKVRRGEYRCVLPTGFAYQESGNVVLDPDLQIRETITYFFETFSRVGSACQTVKAFRKNGLLFPSRLRNSATTIFQPLTTSTAIRTLNNPRYAGAYAYGRRHYRRAADGKKVLRKRECNDWLACIPNAHPGYITWEQFQQNLKTSRDQWPRIRSSACVAAARGHGTIAGACLVWALRQISQSPICCPAGKAGGLVCL